MSTRVHSNPHPQAALPAEGGASLISDERLVGIYVAMLHCRIFSERAVNPSRSGKRSAAFEAVAAATLMDARPEDHLISAAPHRCAALLKGIPLAELLAPLYARSTGAGRGGAGLVHAASGVLVTRAGAGSRDLAPALAAGCAFAARSGNRENVAIAFFRSGRAENSWLEMFRFALAHRLPLILVRQSSHPLRPLSSRSRSGKRVPGGPPVIPVDANDAVAIYRVVHEAIAHARRGSGPTLIDCVPLRMAGERKQDADCIARMERYLQSKGLRPEKIGVRAAQKFTRALDAAIAAARRDVQKNGNRAVPGRSSK